MGMGDVGRCVADALEAQRISYKAIEIDHDRFIQANRDGYPVIFGDGTDLRLMETIEIAHANTLVVTEPRIEIARELVPISRKRYPNLTRIACVDDDEKRLQFEGLGMNAIVDRSFPKGLDIAAATLRAHNIEEGKIEDWMQRQQARALDEKGELINLSGKSPVPRLLNQEG